MIPSQITARKMKVASLQSKWMDSFQFKNEDQRLLARKLESMLKRNNAQTAIEDVITALSGKVAGVKPLIMTPLRAISTDTEKIALTQLFEDVVNHLCAAQNIDVKLKLDIRRSHKEASKFNDTSLETYYWDARKAISEGAEFLPFAASISEIAKNGFSTLRATIGLLSLSLILYSGQHRTRAVAEIIQHALEDPNPFIITPETVSVYVSWTDRETRKVEQRQVFLDAVSVILMIKLRTNLTGQQLNLILGRLQVDPGEFIRSCYGNLKNLLCFHGYSSLAVSLHSVIRGSNSFLRKHAPSTICDFANRKMHGNCTGETSFARMHSLSVTKKDSVSPAEMLYQHAAVKQKRPIHDSQTNLFTDTDYLYEAFAGKNYSSLLGQGAGTKPPLNENLARTLEPLQFYRTYLLHFFEWLVSKGSAGNRNPRYCKQLITSLMDILAPSLQQSPPTNRAQWYAMIEEMTYLCRGSRSSGSHSPRALTALNEFNKFIDEAVTWDHQTEPFKMNILKVGGEIASEVISQDEYSRILQVLQSSNVTAFETLTYRPDGIEILRICRLIVTLLYRTGMRRNECLGLSANEILNDVDLELLIQETPHRRLKTANAHRRIPLHAFLTPEELNDFRDFRSMHAPPGCHEHTLFFGSPLNRSKQVCQGVVFSIIHHAMRQVTGDRKITSYAFRHSFCTRTLLNLFMDNFKQGSPNILMKIYPQMFDDLHCRTKIRRALLRKQTHSGNTLHALSMLMGHSAPDVTCTNYAHALDGILFEVLQQDEIRVETRLIASLLPKSKTSIYEAANAGALNTWVSCFAQNAMRAQDGTVGPKVKIRRGDSNERNA